MSFSSPPSRLGPLQTLTLLLAAVAAVARPDVVNLGTAGDFAILSKSGVTGGAASSVTGDMGTSPIGAAALTGFSLIADSSNQFSTSSRVTGRVYAADYATPAPYKMTLAVSDMQTAYTDAQGRTDSTPGWELDHVELHAGILSGKTLSPGLYKWGTAVSIDASSTLTFDAAGDADAVWILQIAQNFDAASFSEMILTGGAKASNIFWAVAGSTTFGTDSNVKGVFLSMQRIAFLSGASGTGAFLTQKAVTLDGATIVGNNQPYYAPVTAGNTAPGVAPIEESDAAPKDCGSVPALIIGNTALSLCICILFVIVMVMKRRLDAFEQAANPNKAKGWRKGESKELEVNTKVFNTKV